MRKGIELGFFNGTPVVYGGTEPVAIDAQAGKGKLTRFLGVNLVSPRTSHFSKIITDPKDPTYGIKTLAECAATVGWPTLAELRGRFIVAPLGNWNMLGGLNSVDWVTYATATEISARTGDRKSVV